MQPGRNKSPPLQFSSNKASEPVTLLMRARVLHHAGQLDEARSAYKKVLKKAPNNFSALHFYALAEYQSGHVEIGIRHLKRALLINPGSAEAHSDMAGMLLAAKRFEESLASSERAIALDPSLIPAHCNRAYALVPLARLEDSVTSLDNAIVLDPLRADSWSDRGNALHRVGRHAEALASFDKAIAIDPMHDIAFLNRGAVFKHLRQFDDALASYDRALSIGKRPIEAGLGRADVLLSRKDIQGAMQTCTAVLKIAPASVEALNLLGACMALLGDAETATKLYSRALEIDPKCELAISRKIFTMDFCLDADSESQQAARRDWWHQIGADIYKGYAAPLDNDRDPNRRLVIGYVSADFRNHSAAYIFRPVIENHDRQKFEVVCYSGVLFSDPTTKAFEAIADKWREMSRWSDDQLAECIKADKVDILVDLSGHSDGNRLRVFARKVAPVQVTAWGHATGTGLLSIDYLLADPVAIPREVRHFYAETVYDLPAIAIIEPLPDELWTSELPADSNGYLTYGTLNRVSKISDHAIRVWARIMTANPTSRLIIKDHQVDDAAVRHTLLEKFGAEGIAAERLTLLGSSPREEHLLTLRQIDLCLDPFPQAGGVSTWEALHMGVPVVTKMGNTVASRLGGAVLSAAGLPDFIGTDDEQYIQIARDPDLERLRSIRRGLPQFINERCGPVAYTRAVEDAYRTMWQTYCTSPVDQARNKLLGRRDG